MPDTNEKNSHSIPDMPTTSTSADKRNKPVLDYAPTRRRRWKRKTIVLLFVAMAIAGYFCRDWISAQARWRWAIWVNYRAQQACIAASPLPGEVIWSNDPDLADSAGLEKDVSPLTSVLPVEVTWWRSSNVLMKFLNSTEKLRPAPIAFATAARAGSLVVCKSLSETDKLLLVRIIPTNSQTWTIHSEVMTAGTPLRPAQITSQSARMSFSSFEFLGPVTFTRESGTPEPRDGVAVRITRKHVQATLKLEYDGAQIKLVSSLPILQNNYIGMNELPQPIPRIVLRSGKSFPLPSTVRGIYGLGVTDERAVVGIDDTRIVMPRQFLFYRLSDGQMTSSINPIDKEYGQQISDDGRFNAYVPSYSERPNSERPRLLDLGTNTEIPLQAATDASGMYLCFEHAGQRLLLSGFQSPIQCLSTRDGSLLWRVQADRSQSVAMGQRQFYLADGRSSIQVYDIEHASQTHQIASHGGLERIWLSPSERWLVNCGVRLSVIDTKTGRTVACFGNIPGPPQTASFSVDENWIVLGGAFPLVIDMRNPKDAKVYRISARSHLEDKLARFTPDGKRLVMTIDEALTVFPIESIEKALKYAVVD